MELKKEFVEQLGALLPAYEAERLAQALATTAPSVAVRYNTAKCPAGTQLAGEPVPWCPEGRYLTERLPFTFDTDFQSGRYYVQDASSMFVTHVLRSLLGGGTAVRYLDLCAAPGGKTTAALSALPAGSLVVANEVMSARAQVLRENVVKWGDAHCVVTSNTAAQIGKSCAGMFDVVATDMPCSGEGMMRKDAEAAAQWTPALVRQCATLQRSIIADVWPALKPGGLLIYSTCTFNREENELMTEHIARELGAEPVAVPTEPGWNIREAIGSKLPCYRFMPHLTRGEGLFMAVLRKSAGAACPSPRAAKGCGKAKPQPLPAALRPWLTASEEFVMATSADGTSLTALPAAHAEAMTALMGNLHVLHCGVPLGTVKGKKVIPAHALALSQALSGEVFERCEVDYATAIAHMRGEALRLPAGTARGYVLLIHRGQPIGFANNLGNRANNLYPKPWRILSPHLPATEPALIPVR